MVSRVSASAAVRGSSSCSFFLTRWSAARRAERGPSPGSRASSWISRSISGPAATFAMQSEQFQAGRKRQTARQALHLLLHRLLDLSLGVVVSGDDEVLEDLGLAGVEQRRIDADARHVAFAGERDRHHAAAGAALDLRALKLGLHVGDAALQRLRLLHHLGEALHQLVPSSLNSSGASLSGS